MARRKPLDLQQSETDQDRELRWGHFVVNALINWQFADKTGERIFIDRTQISKMVGITVPTLSQWLVGGGYPSRPNAIKFANGLGLSAIETLEAAGYSPGEDDAPVQTILSAIEANAELTNEDRTRLTSALAKLIDPEWCAKHHHYAALAQTTMYKDLTYVQKAEIIASLVTLANRE